MALPQTKKTGRNDPCHCGSGKKYKRCCLQKDDITKQIRQFGTPSHEGPPPVTRIYHGTSARFLPSILKNGIVPRGERPGQWEEYPSRPDMCYLTTVYPGYFALHALDEGETEIVILEIDLTALDRTRLYPDEDFLAEAWESELGERSKAISYALRDNMERFAGAWAESVKRLGNCCYKGVIPASAITRYAIVDVKKQADECADMMDPAICTLNHRLCHDKYHSIVQWLFGDMPEHYRIGLIKQQLAELPGDLPSNFEDYRTSLREGLAHCENAGNDRKGVQVVVMPRTTAA